MEHDSLRALYIDELKDLYNAEKQIVKALPTMVSNATHPSLRKAFSDHLAKTEVHVERLEKIFDSLEASPGGKKCVGMEGIIEEAEELLGEGAQQDVLDAGLISKAQHVEHYEIASYGTVRTYALTLGENEHAQLLQQTLNEEEEADQLLTALAERSINIDAVIADENDEGTSGGRREREVSRHVGIDKERASRSEPSTSAKRTTTNHEDRGRA